MITVDVAARPQATPAAVRHAAAVRWLPFLAAFSVTVGLLLHAGTSPADLLRYLAYATGAIVLPGTLVYRALRRTPHTLVEDVALGGALGLALELPAWAVLSALDLREWAVLWPLTIVAAFVAVPGLRRHWRVRGYRTVPLAWSACVAATVAFFAGYLSLVFLRRNPILPDTEGTRQYLDLAYQLSLAGEVKHHLPVELPQAAGEPLYYHWFGYVHMAMTSMIGQIDLAVVSLRLVVPALCALGIVLTAVVGWRLSGRPYAGIAAVALFWVIGEVNFTDPVSQPFGTQAMFVVWHGMSMTYSWVLLLALIAVIGEVLSRRGGQVPAIGWGAYPLVAAFAFASSGAKASSLPVTLIGLAFTGLVLLVRNRRLPLTVIAVGVIVAAAQVFAAGVLFRFQTYGLTFGPLGNLEAFWREPESGRPGGRQALLIAAVSITFGVNMLVKYLGAVPLLIEQRGRLTETQLFLLGGALAGPLLYLSFTSINSQYFTRAGFAFGVLLAGWGWATLADRTRLSKRAARLLATGAGCLVVALIAAQVLWAKPAPRGRPYSGLIPIMTWIAILAAAGLVALAAWLLLRRRVTGLRGRGALVALTAVLLLGAPAYAMDVVKAKRSPNGGAYFNTDLPKSRVDAARWVRDHSHPDDVLGTNVHCRVGSGRKCDPRSFWLSAYAERRVLVEGWGFAPRRFSGGRGFWDAQLLAANDAAITSPSAELLAQLRQRYGVRWLVVDRKVGRESPELAELARLRYTNHRMAVYEVAG